MIKLLHSDWLRAVQFSVTTVQITDQAIWKNILVQINLTY